MVGPLTAETALSSVQQLVDDLLRSVREIGPLPTLRDMTSDLAALQSYCGTTGTDIDVAVAAPQGAEAAALIAAWISPEFEARVLIDASEKGREVRVVLEDHGSVLRVFPLTNPPAQRAARPRPPVLVCVLGSEDQDASHRTPIAELAEDRPLAFLLRADGPPPAAELLSSNPRQPWLIDTVSGADLSGGAITARIERGNTQLAALLRSYGVLYGLETAADGIRLVVEQEQRSIRVKRALAQQEATKLQQAGIGTTDVIIEMRTRVQRLLAEFEKSVQERMAEMFAPQIGTLTLRVEDQLRRLTDLERVPREKSVELRVPYPVESSVLGTVREAIRERAVSDLSAMRDLLEVVSTEIDAGLTAAGGSPVTLRHVFVPESRLTRIIDSSVRIDRAFRGELPKQGWQEYLQQAKKYQVLLSVLLPVLTLFAVPQTRFLTVYMTITLFVIGATTLPRTIKRERLEHIAKEIEKARDTMRIETRRMFAEAERGWMSAMSDALREEQSSVLIQFETAVREGVTRRTMQLAEDRRRVQRQLQGLENTDRQLAAARRTRDTVVSGIDQMRGALRQLFVSASKAAVRDHA